jgi:cyanophycinase
MMVCFTWRELCRLCAALLFLSVFAVGGCAPDRRHDEARLRTPDLVLAGGGVRDENDAVLDAMVAHLRPGDSAIIIPFASGDQAGSAASAKSRFESRAPKVTFEIMPDPQSDRAVVDACVEMVERAGMVFFTGGDQSRITARLLPPNVGEPIYSALKRARKRGVVFCGTSAGTAVMSATMFTGGGSESALADLPADDGEPDGATANANPPQRGVRLAPGLNMLGRDDVIMDSHVLRRGRFGRMVAALEKTGAKFAVGVADDCAVKISDGMLQAVGWEAVLVIDGRQMTRSEGSLRNVRVNILTQLETYDLDEQLGSPYLFMPFEAHAHVLYDTTARKSKYADLPQPEAWSRDGLLWLSDRLRADRSRVHTLQSERFEVRLSADDFTKFPGPPHIPSCRIINAKLDIVPRASTAPASSTLAP